MWDKCTQCGLFFDTNVKLVNHVKNDHNTNEPEIYKCFLCPKAYGILEDLLHHINLEHKGLDAARLDESTKARETKKQLGSYVGENVKGKSGVIFECPECFEIFSDSFKLDAHRKLIHKMQFTKEAKKLLKELPHYDNKNQPQCEKCKRLFYALVICKMNGTPQSVCLNCYESHYGVNALRRLTIGTPDDQLRIMRKPIN